MELIMTVFLIEQEIGKQTYLGNANTENGLKF